MLFLLTGQDADQGAACIRHLSRRDVIAGAGRLPRIASPGEPPCGRGSLGRGETRNAVADESTRGRRVRCGEKGQYEHVRIPEDMAPIAGAAETSGTERGLRAIGNRRDQVEQREAHGPLQLRVSLDADVRRRPAPRPLRSLLGKQGFDPDPLGGLERLECRLRTGRVRRIAGVRCEPLEPQPCACEPDHALGCRHGNAAAPGARLPAIAGGTASAGEHERAPLRSGRQGPLDCEYRDPRSSERRERERAHLAPRRVELASQGSVAQVERSAPHDKVIERDVVPSWELRERRLRPVALVDAGGDDAGSGAVPRAGAAPDDAVAEAQHGCAGGLDRHVDALDLHDPGSCLASRHVRAPPRRQPCQALPSGHRLPRPGAR